MTFRGLDNTEDILFSNDYNADSYEGTEALTAAEVVKQLEEAWVSESHTPELLVPQTELVECILEQVKNMEENLTSLSKSDFRFSLHYMELERLKYVVSAYLRIRLWKIEKFCSHLLDPDNQRSSEMFSQLTAAEQKFATELNAATDSHLKALALRHMPSNMREMNSKQTAPKPNLNSYVFVRSKQDSNVLVSDGAGGDEEVELRKESQYLLPYNSVSALLQDGHVTVL